MTRIQTESISTVKMVPIAATAIYCYIQTHDTFLLSIRTLSVNFTEMIFTESYFITRIYGFTKIVAWGYVCLKY